MGTNAGALQAAIRIREQFKVPWEVTVQQLVNHKKSTVKFFLTPASIKFHKQNCRLNIIHGKTKNNEI